MKKENFVGYYDGESAICLDCFAAVTPEGEIDTWFIPATENDPELIGRACCDCGKVWSGKEWETEE